MTKQNRPHRLARTIRSGRLNISQDNSKWLLVLALFLLLCSWTYANFSNVSNTRKTFQDARGFKWDLRLRAGNIDDGTNYVFGSACVLSVNGQNFSSNNQKSKGKHQFVLTGKQGKLKVKRHLRLHKKKAGLRYIEQVKNPTDSKKKVKLQIQTRLRDDAQKVVTNTGREGLPLKDKEAGAIMYQQSNNRPSVLFLIRDEGRIKRKVSSDISLNNGENVTISYSFEVPPKESVSVTHTIAQRKTGKLKGNKENIKNAFKPFLSKDWFDDVPKDLRKTILNGPVRYFFFGRPEEGFQKRLQSLNVKQAKKDLLAIGEKAKLTGSLSSGSVRIKTRFGTKEVPVKQVAAATGDTYSRSDHFLFLRDGQVLRGKISFKDTRFNSDSGPSIPVKSNNLDRLVLHQSSGDGSSSAETVAYIDTLSGERIAVTNEELSIPVHTSWGRIDIPLKNLSWARRNTSELYGSRIVLKNGSRFFGFLGHEPITLNTVSFGEQSMPMSRVLMISSTDLNSSDSQPSADEKLENRSHARLKGNNIFTGDFVNDQIKVINKSGTFAVQTNRVKNMKRIEDDSTPPNWYQIKLWSGGTIAGRPNTENMAFRTSGQTIQIPIPELLRINRPVRRLPSGLRNEISTQIRKLGHPSWEVRKKATDKLKEIGSAAIPQLKKSAEEGKDPELKRRVKQIIEELE